MGLIDGVYCKIESPLIYTWLFTLLAMPYLAFPGILSDQTNAVPCIASGFLIACIAEKQLPYGSRLKQSYFVRVLMACVGIALLLPYIFFELGSIPWAFSPNTETLLGYWPGFFRDAFSFFDSTLGYWPLCISSSLLAVFLNSAPQNERKSASEYKNLDMSVLIGLVLAGAARQPLCAGAAGNAALNTARLFAASCLAFAFVRYARNNTDRSSDMLLAYGTGAMLWNEATRVVNTLELFDHSLAYLPTALTLISSVLLLARSTPRVNTWHEEDESSQVDPLATLKNHPAYSALTNAERDCADLLAKGHSISAIASSLGKSPSTVRVLLSRSYKKLGVSSAAELDVLLGDARHTGSDSVEQKRPDPAPSPITGALALVFSLVVLPPLWRPTPAWGLGRELYLPLGTGLLAAGTLRLICPRCRSKAFNRKASVTTVVIGICCLGARYLQYALPQPGYAKPILAIASFSFGLLTAFASSESAEHINLRQIDIPPLLLSAFIGVVVEELWRSMGFFSMLPQLAPLLFAAALGAAILLWHMRRTITVVAIILCAVVLYVAQGDMALGLCCCSLFAANLVHLQLESTVLEGPLPYIAPSFGFGILAGDYLVGSFADRLSFNDTVLQRIGGQSGLLSLGGFLLGLAFCIVGIAVIAYTFHLLNDMSAEQLRIEIGDADYETRAVGLFTARGLNKTEAAVLLRIAAGLSATEISEEINYSRGTINTARLSGYAKLNVHSRKELIVCISAGTCRVNR